MQGQKIVGKRSQVLRSYKKQHIDNKIDKIKDLLPSNITYLNKSYNIGLTDTKFDLHCNCCDKDFNINRQLLFFRIKDNEDPCLN